MELALNVDRSSNIPVYKQIIEQITIMVRNSELKAGDKLPAERELANSMDVARGTIKKAYEELERSKVIEVLQGSGSFVSKKQDVLHKDRKQKAIELIDEMLENMEVLGFNYHEVNTLTKIRIMERNKGLGKIKIAGIDCNPEALSIFKNQLSYISNVEFTRFLLVDLENCSNPADLLGNFDVIITTSTHYEELQNLIPELQGKIVRAAVSPSQQTVIDIATIPAGASIGIVCSSKQFLDIIKSRLKSFDIKMKNVSYLLESADADYKKFFMAKDILILPPEFEAEKDSRYAGYLTEFKLKDGKIILFEYQIERGSLIYIEERISKVLNKK